ncbi:DUF192 domain-containing protein [Undibacterium sp. SXout11W]|uniref:DUF192 domain-containing protein n=1 Tax=Undibacterium sp. SXout11W TaxID=3413050 RepID=UPI003BF182CA
MTKISIIAMQLFSAASLALISTASQAQIQGKLPVKQLSAGIYVIRAEVAASPAEREQGLMSRTKMGSNEGMIFDFGAPAKVCMWMKNTLIPLSVAFIDQEGKIVNIEDMQPETLDSHCGNRNVYYALEMNLGWFKQKNIKPGTKIEGLPLK